MTQTPPNSGAPARFSQPLAAVWRALFAPSRTAEIVGWIILIAVIVGVRMYLWHLLPAYLWSKDSMRYAQTPLAWLDTGVWENDPKRGPIYSLLLAFCLKLWGSFNAVVILQHALGGLAVLGAALLLRAMHGVRALWVILACGLGYAVYGQVLYLEHLIRNDLLLLVLATAALAAWWLALEREKAAWLFPCGLAVAVLTINKNVFGPFPLIVLAAAVWSHRRAPRTALRHAALFLVGLALPYAGTAAFKKVTVTHPDEPQSGAMFFARVAQFAVLDGGIAPEAKALIREDIEHYRTLPELDNNLILQRTAVPRLRGYYFKKNWSHTDVDRLCRQMAVEAIRAHPREYAAQIGRDFQELHLETGSRMRVPSAGDIRAARDSLPTAKAPARLEVPATLARLEPGTHAPYFKRFHSIAQRAWLFKYLPVLLTSLGVTVLAIAWRGKARAWWLGAAAVWWFTVLMLITVGRPLSRYLLPVIPIMFWTLGTLLALGWNWLGTRLARSGAGSG